MNEIRPVFAVIRNDFRIMLRDPMPVMILVVVPILLMIFLKPAAQTLLESDGVTGTNGAEQAVPGMTVTFGFFLIGNISFGFFREHGWHTWDRLRASALGSGGILVGKLVIPFLQAVAQFVLLFGVAGFALGLHVRGSWLEVCLVGLAFAIFLMSLGVAVTAFCSTFMQANAIAVIGALVLSCFAGAIVPASALPTWATAVSPAIPSYWAMRGYESAILGGHGGVIQPTAVLLGISLVLCVAASLRMRFDETKTGLV